MTTKEDELLIALRRMAAHSGEAVAHLARKAIDAYMHAQQAEEPKLTVEERLDALEQRVQHEMDVNDSLARLNTDAHAALKHESMQAIQDHEYMHHPQQAKGWGFAQQREVEDAEYYILNSEEEAGTTTVPVSEPVVDPGDGPALSAYIRSLITPEPLPEEAPPGPPEAERGARDRAAECIKAHRDRLAANLGAQLWSAGVVIVKYDVVMALLDATYSLFSPDTTSTAELAERLVKAYEKGN